MTDDILFERVLKKVELAAGHAPNWLNPALSESSLRAFEEDQRIALPRGYRRFLREAGNGGGMFMTGRSARHWDDGLWPLDRWHALLDDVPSGFLARPSPIVPGYQPPGASDAEYQGLIPLMHEGCGWVSMLVVSGPSAGRVVSTDGGYTPPHVAGNGFLEWFDRALDVLLKQART